MQAIRPMQAGAFKEEERMRVAQRNFTGGEISASLSGRYDMAKRSSSCRHLENFLPELHGPLARRMGTYFLEDLGGPAVLISFEFSSDPAQNYVLVVQAGRIRVAQKNGFVLRDGLAVEIEAPYAEEQLYDVYHAQSGDMVYLAHPAHQLRKLVRYGHTDWRMEPVRFAPSIDGPASVSVGFSGAGGGFALRYKVAAVNGRGEVSRAVAGAHGNAKHPNDWVVGDYATVGWSAAAGAESYNIYREDAGVFGLVGVAEGLSFRDDKYMADTADTPSEPQNPFMEDNNPSVVCFHQQRLVLGAPALEPQKWYASRTGSYEDLAKSRPVKDDDSLEFTLASGRIDNIQWMAAFGDLLIGASGSEYKAIGVERGTITPSSVNVREQSFWGSLKLRPLIIGNSVLHVQRQGSRVRDLFYSLERDGYAGNDLSVMASHLFNGYLIKQWDYQQSPGSTVWAVRDDGMLLVLTYMKEHDIWGWSRVTTQGRFRSVACTAGYLEDDLYAVVERDIQGEKRWYLERFMPKWDSARMDVAEAFFVDSGLSYSNPDRPVRVVRGLDHLEGCAVSLLVDGSPEAPLVVQGGAVTLPRPGRRVTAGLAYTSLMSPQTPEADLQNGSTLGRARNYSRSELHLLESVSGKYGPSPRALYPIPQTPEAYDRATTARSYYYSFTPGGGYSGEGSIWFAQDLPLPFTIAALVLDVDLQG